MAAKRCFDGDEDQPNQKRMKTRPSFASVIREVVIVNFFENFCSALEPMLRRVVSEEVENGLRRRCMSCPSLKLLQQPPPSPADLRLTFVKRLSPQIFTGTKIVDAGGDPLQIILIDHNNAPTSPPHPMKIEIMVVDGDFPHGDSKDAWTNEEFARNIVKERNGKRPLLAGELSVTLRDGICAVGDVEFTDNSSWIRSRKFRLAARVVALPGQTFVREAITEPFVVKDHRGELYRKHHPPALEDEVWRLEKIGKGGAFHQKLSSNAIDTVQDFLKLYTVDASKLRKILGGMSDKMWEVTLKHAKTCVMGTKVYKLHGHNYSLTLSPICQLIEADFHGQAVYHQTDLKNLQTDYIESLVKEAYAKWNSLEESDDGTALLTQGETVGQYFPNEEQQIVVSEHSSFSVMQNNGDDPWALNSAGFYANTSTPKSSIRFFSESSSDGDIP